jgi:D-glycerate 3-kinase
LAAEPQSAAPQAEPWADGGRWRHRLQRLGGLPAIDPSLLWGVAIPMLTWLERAHAGGAPTRLPLLALNGPVGAGKTSLARLLQRLAPLAGLRLAVASIDDLYLPWPQRQQVLAGNPFGVGRVPPGSHDLPLLLDQLTQWRRDGVLCLPRFDKRLAGGQGDRVGGGEVRADALLLEGWLMGCRALPQETLARRLQDGDGVEDLTPEELDWLPRWNRELAGYHSLWEACDGLWVLRPQRWSLVRRWRFQAEARQRRSGGGWLSPAELEGLVRASLCSLPPRLYQEPLLASPQGRQGPALVGAVVLDGRRRCRAVVEGAVAEGAVLAQSSSVAGSSAIG